MTRAGLRAGGGAADPAAKRLPGPMRARYCISWYLTCGRLLSAAKNSSALNGFTT